MQMSNPYPLRSPLDPNTASSLKDYDYVAPLKTDGSNYPCKGYQYDSPLRTTATYQAGGTYQMSLSGSAFHLGGSCQLALSYDNGATFKVIKSMIGGCPKQQSYNFTVPYSAPDGTALFAWTWFNYEGNREFYMNCAAVQIVNSNAQLASSLEGINTLPNLWRANIAGTGCVAAARQNAVFPNPGPDVLYGDGMSSASPPTPGDCDGSGSSSNTDSSYLLVLAEQSASPTADDHHYADPTSYENAPISTTAPQYDDGQYRWKAPTPSPQAQFAETMQGAGMVTETTTSCPPTTTTTTTPTPTPTTLSTAVRGAESSSAAPPPSPPASNPPPASPPQPSSPPPPSQETPPYATGDPSLYLPCAPGTFLCTSASTFLTCDQTVPGTAPQQPWEYLYPRDVAEGMACAPRLVRCEVGWEGCGTGERVPVGWRRDDVYVRSGA
ncbi:hypothetical protein W97_04002 [Coniosporium apollinis CBS 100218]|uniref:Chitin-binding type-4 domain-containing protein n=1 Tax=Coniosporium apollinis (strain CBS 100218) TaxID=1168221 RepID=R7YSH0_CONA1|nr:uncharacterized protein W97_04002 [Coniosporium apollinis CBS 100218]EON64769.1 hypothetical protein W97_04002 [Coniosporium apollinis CBS 100218]